MVDMEGIDLLAVQGEIIPGLYNKLVESIALCRYQCVYNWSFNSILIPPTYVEMEEREDGVWINEGVMVDEEDVVHIASIEPEPPAPVLPVIESLSFGSSGTKVNARLSVTDESAIASLQSGGWNANGMAFYDSENQIGAYGGYDFGEQLFITKVKLWLGRYSGQNANLNISVEYLDQSDTWNDIESLVIATNLSYPSNVFIVNVNRNVKGIRWIHKNPPNKTGGNNVTFAGMTVYTSTGEMIPCFVPVSGLNSIPGGYTGFGPVFVQ